jgi:hypothetical protein
MPAGNSPSPWLRRVVLAVVATGFAFALLAAGSLANLPMPTGRAWLPQGGFDRTNPLISGGHAVKLDGVTARCAPGDEVRLEYVRVRQGSIQAHGSWAEHACTHTVASGPAKGRLVWRAIASVARGKLDQGRALAQGASIILRNGKVLTVLPWQQHITLT